MASFRCASTTVTSACTLHHVYLLDTFTFSTSLRSGCGGVSADCEPIWISLDDGPDLLRVLVSWTSLHVGLTS